MDEVGAGATEAIVRCWGRAAELSGDIALIHNVSNRVWNTIGTSVPPESVAGNDECVEALLRLCKATLSMLENARDDVISEPLGASKTVSLFRAEQRTIVAPQDRPEDVKHLCERWFYRHAEVEIAWISSMVSYAIHVMFHAGKWRHVHAIATRFNAVTERFFAGANKHVLVYAQTQLATDAVATHEQRAAELVTIDDVASALFSEIEAAKAARHSQRGKNDEERKLQEAKDAWTSEREPLVAALNVASESRRDEERKLQEVLASERAHTSETKPSYGRLQNARARVAIGAEDGVEDAYASAVKELRSRQDTVLLVAALHELGDFSFANGRVDDAVSSWNDAVDAMFGRLGAVGTISELVASPLLETFGVDMCLGVGVVLAKLAEHGLSCDIDTRHACTIAASSLLAAVFDCDVLHPPSTKPHRFAAYETTNLWPDVMPAIFLARCRPGAITVACRFLTRELIESVGQPELSLPLCSLWLYLAGGSSSAEPLKWRAKALAREGADNSVADDNDSFEAHVKKSTALEALGQRTEAIRECAAALRLGTRDARLWTSTRVRLAALLLSKNRREDAIAHAEKALEEAVAFNDSVMKASASRVLTNARTRVQLTDTEPAECAVLREHRDAIINELEQSHSKLPMPEGVAEAKRNRGGIGHEGDVSSSDIYFHLVASFKEASASASSQQDLEQLNAFVIDASPTYKSNLKL